MTRWVVSFVLFGGLAVLWGLATPIPSGPDEPAQIIKAAAVAKGQLIGVQPANFPKTSAVVRIPEFVDRLPRVAPCYYGDPAVAAHACAVPVSDPGQTVYGSTYVAHYQPTYYAVVGIPILAVQGMKGVRLMRMMSGLYGALFLSLALAAAASWARSRWLVAGVALAVTPVAFYNVSIINPNGLEIASAIATWTAGTILVFDAPKARLGPLVVFVFSACVLSFTRPLSFLWVPAILVTLAVLDWSSVRRLWSDRRVRVSVAICLAVVLGSIGYVKAEGSLAVEHFPLAPGYPTHSIVHKLLTLIPTWITEFVGQYGSPNFGGPRPVVIIWLLGAAALVGAGAAAARWSQRIWFLLFTVVAVAVFPFLATLAHARLQGFGWQGRYNLPLAVGVPILAGALAKGTRFGVGPRLGLIGVWTIGQAISLYYVFARYRFGLAAVLHPLRAVSNPWEPPIGTPAVLALGAALLAAGGLMLWVFTMARSADRELRSRPDRITPQVGALP